MGETGLEYLLHTDLDRGVYEKMDSLNSITDRLSPELKQRGYKKRKLSWYKQLNGTTVVFAIQRSQYSSEVWYYNYGIGINSFFKSSITSLSQCDVIYRLDQKLHEKLITFEHLISILDYWEKEYGRDLNTLREKAVQNKLPQQTTRKAIQFLTSFNTGLSSLC